MKVQLKNKRYALITGATGGIGSSYAMQLAMMGFNLYLTSTKKEELTFLQETLSKRHEIEVIVQEADLTNEKDRNKLLGKVKKLPNLDILINNAGFGIGDYFQTSDYEYVDNMVKLHAEAVVHLTYELIPKLLKEKRSYLINVASLAAFFPMPKSSVYSATKAFLVSFSESLHLELKSRGLRVQALCPGFTRTRFFEASTKNTASTPKMKWLWMTPNRVVKTSINHLIKRKNSVVCIPGIQNKFLRTLGKILPRRIYYLIQKAKG